MEAFSPAATAAPLAETERAELLDALRGFALFGVCLANLYGGFCLWGDPGAVPPAQLPTAATDWTAAFLIRGLIEGKFYSLFSLLFGIGFAVQLQRASQRGDEQLRSYRRRLWVLLGIGLVHLIFVWPGDILAFYALVGLLLVRLRHLSDRAIFRWALVLLILPVPLWAIFWLGGGWKAAVPLTPAAPFYAIGDAITKPLGLKSFYDVVANPDLGVFYKSMRAGFFFRAGDLLFQWRVCKVLAMFLLGLWVGRHQIFRQPAAHRPLLRRVATWGLALGLAANLLNAALEFDPDYFGGKAPGLVYAALYALGVAPLALGYAATFALVWLRPGGYRALRGLAPLGRMALSCYLTQSFIAIFLFHGFGLGWVGRLGPTLLWPLALSILTLELLACRWWLRRYQFGPAEWLWRSLSYGQWQPLRRAQLVVG
jgi:uncharacterized protein